MSIYNIKNEPATIADLLVKGSNIAVLEFMIRDNYKGYMAVPGMHKIRIMRNAEPLFEYGKTICNMDDIKNIGKELYPDQYDLVFTKTRKREVVWARQVMMYMAKNYCHPALSLAAIGFALGPKDHATVLHANKRIAGFIDVYPRIMKEVSLFVDQVDKLLKNKVKELKTSVTIK